MSQPVYTPFQSIYDNNNRWIISSQDEASVFDQMKQFAFPRSIDEQRLRPYVVYNKDTRRVWYHCQPVLSGNHQITTEYEYVFKLIKQTFGSQTFYKQPLITAQCMMTSDEIQTYIRDFPDAVNDATD